MVRECLCCHTVFSPRYNVPSQQYCSKLECQRTRKARWQRRKLAEDIDYRENQKSAQQKWMKQCKDYMRNYRKAHPEYRERDREQRRNRRIRQSASTPQEEKTVRDHPALESCAANAGGGATGSTAVNMDECSRENASHTIESGIFRICSVTSDGAVKMDACRFAKMVQIIVLQGSNCTAAVHCGAP